MKTVWYRFVDVVPEYCNICNNVDDLDDFVDWWFDFESYTDSEYHFVETWLNSLPVGMITDIPNKNDKIVKLLVNGD